MRRAAPFRGTVRAVMLRVTDPEAACRWWAEHLDGEATQGELGWWFATPSGLELVFLPREAGRAGSDVVAYLAVTDVDDALTALTAAGASVRSSAEVIEPGRRIAEVVDPFGCVVGLDGP